MGINRKSREVTVSRGSIDAGALTKLSANGRLDSSMLDPTEIAEALDRAGPFADGTSIYFNQELFDERPGYGVLANQEVLADAGILNLQSTSGLPLMVTRKKGKVGFADHNLHLYSEDLSQWLYGTRKRVGEHWEVSKTLATSSEYIIQPGTVFGSPGLPTGAIVRLRAGTTNRCDLGIYNNDGDPWGTAAAPAVILSGPGTIEATVGALALVVGLSASEDTVVFVSRTPTATQNSLILYPDGNASTTIGASVLIRNAQAFHGTEPLEYVRTGAAAVFAPPLEYDARVGSNYIFYSGDMGNATWTKTGSAAAAVGVVRSNGVRMSLVSVAAGSYVHQPATLMPVASGRMEPSVWIERVSKAGQLILVNLYQIGAPWWTIDLAMLPDTPTRVTRHHPAVKIDIEMATAADRYMAFGVSCVGAPVSAYIACALGLGEEPPPYIETAGTVPLHQTADPGGVYPLKRLASYPATTNAFRNGIFAGAVAGTPGTLPTNAPPDDKGALSRTIALGSENGIPHMDVRYFGTANQAYIVHYLSAPNEAAASPDQIWSSSIDACLVGGSMSNVSQFNNVLQFRNASLSAILERYSIEQMLLPGWQRFKSPGLVAPANTAWAGLALVWWVTNGAAIDFTIRIRLPQLEQKPICTPPILTTGAAATRSETRIVGLDLDGTGDNRQMTMAMRAKMDTNVGERRWFTHEVGAGRFYMYPNAGLNNMATYDFTNSISAGTTPPPGRAFTAVVTRSDLSMTAQVTGLERQSVAWNGAMGSGRLGIGCNPTAADENLYGSIEWIGLSNKAVSAQESALISLGQL